MCWPYARKDRHSKALPRPEGVLLALVVSLLPQAGPADSERGEVHWATGAALASRLATPVGITLGGSPLREGLYRFGRTQQVAVLLDRRIDPGQELDVTLHQVPLGQAFRDIAERGKMGVTQLGPLFYFGPEPAAAKLRTLAAMTREQLQGLPRDVALRLARARAWRWDDLATPRDLLGLLAKEGQFELEGLERIPHDLWAAADLPSLSLLDRLTLITIQFNLTFLASSDGATIQLAPLPSEIGIVRRYPGAPHPNEAMARIAALAPGAQVRLSGGEVLVKGSVEEHERIAASRTPSRPDENPGDAGDVGLTRIERMAVENVPVGAVLKHIASQLNLELRIDHAALREAGVSLTGRITVHAEGISLDELLEQVAGSAGLALHRDGRVVDVRPEQ